MSKKHPTETWRPVPGFPGYQVSSLGTIYSNRQGGRELRPARNAGGYPHVSLRRDGERHHRYVHQLVAEVFIGPRPVGMEVRHLDGDRLNNSADNLQYGTAAENAQDRVRHGTDQNVRKTECHRGHPFDERNTRINAGGSRSCRACGRTASQTYRANMAERVPA